MSAPPAADASVRLARAVEVEALAGVQQRALAAYGSALPAAVRDVAADDLSAAWREAVVRPPTARHRVLVALAGSTVVGLAATAPNEDPDAEAGADGELLAFHVDPARTGEGHGSRLLQASVDTLRADGFRRGYAWLLAVDEAQQRFFGSAGWEPDGARRELELDLEPSEEHASLGQLRLHTDLVEVEA